jgi:hypothetical protein
MPRRAKPSFKEIKGPSAQQSSGAAGDLSLVEYQRLAAKQQLPGANPFWTRHATTSGIVPLNFDTNAAAGVQDGVDVDVSEGDYNFEKTPLLLAWFRFANADSTYSDSTAIYRYPLEIGGGSFEQFISADRKLLRFYRRSITPSGVATPTRIYIKFFIFDDDPFKNPNPITQFGTE